MLAMVELPAVTLLKNSCILAYTCFKRTVPATLLGVLLLFLSVGLFPYSLVFVATLAFSLGALISCFFAVSPIEEHILGIRPAAPAAQDAENQLEEAETNEEFPEWEEGEN